MQRFRTKTMITYTHCNSADDLKYDIHTVLAASPWTILRKGRTTLKLSSKIGELEINENIVFFSSHNSKYCSIFCNLKELNYTDLLTSIYGNRNIQMNFVTM